MTDLVNHPAHYQTVDGIKGECIDYTRQMPYSIGCAFKYVWRAGSKDDAQQDLDKAIWYLNDALNNGPRMHARVPLLSDGSTLKITRRYYVLACIARDETYRAKQLLEALTDPAQLEDII